MPGRSSPRKPSSRSRLPESPTSARSRKTRCRRRTDAGDVHRAKQAVVDELSDELQAQDEPMILLDGPEGVGQLRAVEGGEHGKEPGRGIDGVVGAVCAEAHGLTPHADDIEFADLEPLGKSVAGCRLVVSACELSEESDVRATDSLDVLPLHVPDDSVAPAVELLLAPGPASPEGPIPFGAHRAVELVPLHGFR